MTDDALLNCHYALIWLWMPGLSLDVKYSLFFTKSNKDRYLQVATTWKPPTLKSSLTRPNPIPREAPVTRTTLRLPISSLQLG